MSIVVGNLMQQRTPVLACFAAWPGSGHALYAHPEYMPGCTNSSAFAEKWSVGNIHAK